MNFKYFDINEQGHSIKCKIYYNDIRNINSAVIYIHGFAGHKDNKACERFAQTLLSKQKKFAVISFNLPCHGDDVKKRLNLEDSLTYIELVTEHTKSSFGANEIFAYTTSFGSYLLLNCISKKGNPFKKAVLRSPALNIYESMTSSIIKSDEMEALQKGKDVAVGFDRKINVNGKFLEDLKQNDILPVDFIDFADDLLIIQGTKDEIIPYDTVKKFAENNVIEFIPVENANHRFQDFAQMGNAIRDIINFFLS